MYHLNIKNTFENIKFSFTLMAPRQLSFVYDQMLVPTYDKKKHMTSYLHDVIRFIIPEYIATSASPDMHNSILRWFWSTISTIKRRRLRFTKA